MITKHADLNDTQRALLHAAGAIGGGAAGYLGSKYIFDINDTPINMLSAGAGAGAGLVGTAAMLAQGKQEKDYDTNRVKTIEGLQAKGAGKPDIASRIAYSVEPKIDKQTGTGLAIGGAVAVPMALRAYGKHKDMSSDIAELNRLEALQTSAKKAGEIPDPIPSIFQPAMKARADAINNRGWNRLKGPGKILGMAAAAGVPVMTLLHYAENYAADAKK